MRRTSRRAELEVVDVVIGEARRHQGRQTASLAFDTWLYASQMVKAGHRNVVWIGWRLRNGCQSEKMGCNHNMKKMKKERVVELSESCIGEVSKVKVNP